MPAIPQLNFYWLSRFFNPRLLVLYLLSLAAYLFLGYFTPRTEFLQLISLYSSLFLLFGLTYSMVRTSPDIELTLYASIVFRFALLFCLPALSDDFYRFYWDGWLMTENMNPFSYLPSEIASHNPGLLTEEAKSAFQNMNSAEYYSIYPPLLQYVFWMAALLSPNSIWGGVVVMKSFLFLMEAGTIFFMMRLGWYFRLRRKHILLYALNPLVIIELTGNLHFEAVMIFFVVTAAYFILKRMYLSSAMAFALGVGAKLWPLMFMPFLIRRLGWMRFLQYCLVMAVTLVVVFIPFYTPDLLPNFFSSISLYFQHFEFNGSIYYLMKSLMSELSGYHMITTTGRVLAGVTTITIVAIAILDRQYSMQSFFRKALLSLAIYLFLATTVHPWYLSPLIAFCVFTSFRFPLAWAIVIPFTYLTYQSVPYEENLWVVAIEYAIVLPMFILDLVKDRQWEKSLLRWWIDVRANVKIKRMKGWFSWGEKVLDIGSGNGGVDYKLYQKGIDITPLDVKNHSKIPQIQPVIYNGKQIPFGDNSFHTVLLLTVLHHTSEPYEIVKEAKRVGQRIIVMEDIFYNPLQKRLTFWMDSLLNLEFKGHPHTNKTDEEWRSFFKQIGLRLTKVRYDRVLLIFQQVTYELVREETEKPEKSGFNE